MRDPARINRMIEKVRALWLSNPDLRLGQLIDNVVVIARQEGGSQAATFYMEDPVLEDGLDAALERWGGGRCEDR